MLTADCSLCTYFVTTLQLPNTCWLLLFASISTPSIFWLEQVLKGECNQSEQVLERIAAQAPQQEAVSSWLGRFQNLLRPIEASQPITDVQADAKKVASGLLQAKAALSATQVSKFLPQRNCLVHLG